MSIMEKLNTVKQYSELSYYLASDYEDIKGGSGLGWDVSLAQYTAQHSEPSHELPQLQHGMDGGCLP